MPTSRSTLLLSLLLTACGDSGEPTTTASRGQPATEPTTSSSSEPTTTTTTTTTTSDSSSDATPTSGAMTSGGDEVAGLELLPRLAGLWSGPATMTPLGTFPLMNMDLRAASGQVLFARADLDALTSLTPAS